jgi:hypothetical protein
MAEALFLPFDEADLSEIAYDYSPGAHHAALTGARFVEGREGNCVYFPSDGFAEIIPPVLDLSDTYTMMLWAMGEQQIGGTGLCSVVFKFAGDDQYLVLDTNATINVWTHIGITHEAGSVRVYINSRQAAFADSPGGWGAPTGMCILVDNGHPGAGHCYIDNFKILTDVVYGESDFIPIISNSTLTVKFSINGVDLKSLGIRVGPNPKGIIDELSPKESNSYAWKDHHGRQQDLEDRRYDTRNIEMDCWFSSVGQDAMIENIMAIRALFRKNGTQRLMVEIGTKPFVYEVCLIGGIEFTNKWRPGKAFCSFTLKMEELEPVKRVLRYIKVDESTPDMSITLTCPYVLNIYWGDGEIAKNVFGTNVTVTHEYAEPGTYYPIITGVIEEITNFSQNAVVVWNSL